MSTCKPFWSRLKGKGYYLFLASKKLLKQGEMVHNPGPVIFSFQPLLSIGPF